MRPCSDDGDRPAALASAGDGSAALNPHRPPPVWPRVPLAVFALSFAPHFTYFGRLNQGKSPHVANKIDEMSAPAQILGSREQDFGRAKWIKSDGRVH
jgi:hypothetical protein